MQAIAVGHCLGLDAPVGIEGGNGLHALTRRMNRRETAVGGVREFLNSGTAAETAATGKVTGMIEEIMMSFEIGHTAVVGERIGTAQRHHLALVVPGAEGRGGGAVADVLWHSAGSVKEVISGG